MNYVLAVVILAAIAGIGCGIAYLAGRIIARREAQVPTDVLGRKL